MATRPVFFPGSGKGSWVRLEEADFEWHPGMSLAQKQRSSRNAKRCGRASSRGENPGNFQQVAAKARHAFERF